MGLNITREVHTTRGYRFGSFVLDLDRAELFQDGELVKLRRQSFDVLRYLVDRNGRLVEKRELLRAIWGNAEVTEDSLTHCIIDIRKTLGDFDRNMIQTVPRRGFVFEVGVERISVKPNLSLPHMWSLIASRRAAFLLVVIVALLFSLSEYRSSVISSFGPSDATLNSHNSEAIDRYTQARFLFNRRAPGDLLTARDYYRQAIELEPDFADAWAGLAGTYAIEWNSGANTEADLLAQQKAAAEKAVAIDPGLAEGWVRLSGYYSAIGDPEAAVRYLDRAMDEEPDDPLLLAMLAGQLAARGEIDQAIVMQQQALDRDPLSFTNRGNLSYFLFSAGRYEEALQENRRAFKMRPVSTTDTDTLQGFSMILLQRYEDALELINAWPDGPDKNAASAMAHLKLGNKHEAAAAIDLLMSSTSTDAYFRRAELLAFCEEFDQSFLVLDEMHESLGGDVRARLEQLDMMNDIYLSPFLAPLRNDRRWESWLSGIQTVAVAEN